MNQRIQKTVADIEKTKARIAELQTRLRELEAQKVDLENTEIVSLFRSVDVAPQELAGFIRAYKAQSAYPQQTGSRTPGPAYQTGQEEPENEE